MASKRHEPTSKTRAEVAALVSFGIPQEDIGRYIGVTHPTLRKHYQDELELSAIKANAQVGKFLYSLASGQAMKEGAGYTECSRAAFFWAKTRMGWRETNRHEHTGAEGGAIQTEDVTQRDADAFARAVAGLASRSTEASEAREPEAGDESGA